MKAKQISDAIRKVADDVDFNVGHDRGYQAVTHDDIIAILRDLAAEIEKEASS